LLYATMGYKDRKNKHFCLYFISLPKDSPSH